MNPYEVLEVSPAASLAEIEARYRSLLLTHHPDLHRQEGPDVVARAEKTTRQLNQAMAILRRQHPASGVRVGPTTDVPGSAAGPGGSAGGAPTGSAAGRTSSDGIGFTWGPPPRDPDRVYTCPLCGTVSTTLPVFEAHVADAHGIVLDAPPKPRRRRRRIAPATSRLVRNLVIFVVLMALTIGMMAWAGTQVQFFGSFIYVPAGVFAAWTVLLAWLLLARKR